jgi:hypothetical protein
MAARDPRTGRFVSTTNAPEASEGKFETETGIPIEDVSGAPSANTIDQPRRGPAADELAQGGERFSLHPRHPVLVAADEQARTRYGAQGALTRDAARLHSIAGPLAYVLGVDDGPNR